MKKLIKLLCCLLIFNMFFEITSYALNDEDIPQELIISTEHKVINSIIYEDYTISACKIKSDNRDDVVVYCLEIDESYPSKQVFKLKGEPEETIRSIMNCGYPCKAPEELNLRSENEAYFATQIAIWFYLEKYDVNKISGNNANMVNAIQSIYREGLKNNIDEMYDIRKYQCDNGSIQKVVTVFENTDDETTVKNPHQEG